MVEPDGFPLGGEEIEARAQVLWNEWLKYYFSGAEFTTPGASGDPEQKTFVACELLFDRATPSDNPDKPVIHMITADRRRGREVSLGRGVRAHQEVWTWNFMVRTGAQQPVSVGKELPDDAGVESDRVNRRVAGQLDWLLRSPEGQALALKGISRLEVPGPPRIIQSGSWCMRQLVATASITVRIADNPPA